MINSLSKLYLSLDHILDIKSLDSIVDDTIAGIAKSRYAAGPTNTGPGYTDTSKQSVYEIYREIMDNPAHPHYTLLSKMKNWEPYTFIQYRYPSHVLGQVLVLRSSGTHNYDTKSSKDHCVDYPIIQNFAPLIEFIKSQNIFSIIGRIVIFLNDPMCPTLEHRDYKDGVSRNDEFIWMCPLQNKKLYITDGTQKYYIDSKICYFNNANIHGCDATNESTFSIRIDGKFSTEFRTKASLGD